MDMISIRRKLMTSGGGSTAIIATATGNPLSFVTDMVRPLKSLVIPFTPIQEGSGDPSPTNVRPISGWTGANILAAGVNILGTKDENGYFATYIPANTAITISEKASSRDTVRFYRKDKTQIVYYYLQSVSGDYRYRANLKIVEPVYYVKFGNNDTEQQCCFGTDLRPYKLPSMTNLPINWETEAGTVYGGTVTLNEDGSADLVEDWYHFIVNGDTNKATSSSAATVGDVAYRRYSKYLNETAKNIIGTRWLSSSVMCDGCKVARTVASGAGEEMFVYSSFNYWYVYIREDALAGTTADDFNAYMREHPIAISAKAESGYSTPNIYHFSNIGQLITFVGTNNIWTDTNGTNTATYLKHQS